MSDPSKYFEREQMPWLIWVALFLATAFVITAPAVITFLTEAHK